MEAINYLKLVGFPLKLFETPKITLQLRNKMKCSILTPSSFIIHENEKMSKVLQRYHEKHPKLKIAQNIVQIPN